MIKHNPHHGPGIGKWSMTTFVIGKCPMTIGYDKHSLDNTLVCFHIFCEATLSKIKKERTLHFC